MCKVKKKYGKSVGTNMCKLVDVKEGLKTLYELVLKCAGIVLGSSDRVVMMSGREVLGVCFNNRITMEPRKFSTQVYM